MSNTPTTMPEERPAWHPPPNIDAKKANKEPKRQPLQPRSINKRARPHDSSTQDDAKPNKVAKKTTELENLSDLVERTETAIYSRNQVRKMPRKKLENAYFSLQDTSTQVFLPAQKQKLASQDGADGDAKVPDVVMGICNNYIEITAQLLKMMEKTEDEKQHLQNELDVARRQNEGFKAEIQNMLRKLCQSDEERLHLKRWVDAKKYAAHYVGAEVKNLAGSVDEMQTEMIRMYEECKASEASLLEVKQENRRLKEKHGV